MRSLDICLKSRDYWWFPSSLSGIGSCRNPVIFHDPIRDWKKIDFFKSIFDWTSDSSLSAMVAILRNSALKESVNFSSTPILIHSSWSRSMRQWRWSLFPRCWPDTSQQCQSWWRTWSHHCWTLRWIWRKPWVPTHRRDLGPNVGRRLRCGKQGGWCPVPMLGIHLEGSKYVGSIATCHCMV